MSVFVREVPSNHPGGRKSARSGAGMAPLDRHELGFSPRSTAIGASDDCERRVPRTFRTAVCTFRALSGHVHARPDGQRSLRVHACADGRARFRTIAHTCRTPRGVAGVGKSARGVASGLESFGAWGRVAKGEGEMAGISAGLPEDLNEEIGYFCCHPRKSDNSLQPITAN